MCLTLTLFKNARYETPCYEKVRVRNVWHPALSVLEVHDEAL